MRQTGAPCIRLSTLTLAVGGRFHYRAVPPYSDTDRDTSLNDIRLLETCLAKSLSERSFMMRPSWLELTLLSLALFQLLGLGISARLFFVLFRRGKHKFGHNDCINTLSSLSSPFTAQNLSNQGSVTISSWPSLASLSYTQMI